ncbi:restriction endonuclease subunit S [Haemophilus parahaemolyticus]|uniref:restriction endonuclease subunit S n=1 Tax=Haemophilus parahaemolyticus TaxID=735 RepID=UPI003CD0D5E3
MGEFSKTTIGEFVIKTKQNPNSKYPVYNGGVSYTGFYDDFNNNGHKIIVSARGANAGFINIINGKYWAGNSCYSIDIQSDNYCIEYVYHFMKHKQHLFTDFQQAANIPSVSKKNVEEFLISYPRSKEEQTQIGNFFKQLDDTIALHQGTLEKYQKLKVSYLEKMFPKENERYPELRFPNFTDAWEQRKLEDVSFSYSGGTPSVNNLSFYGGSIPFIRSGEINDETTELFITEEGLNNSSAKLVEKGNILYALYGATSGEVGRAKIHGAINQAILAIVPYVNYDSEFIAQWLRRNKYSIISTYLQGGQGNLSGEIVKNLILELPPSKEEQTKIGNFFKQLDDTIALHQREVEKYKKIKQSYLEKMFI